jgi:histone H3/H4
MAETWRKCNACKNPIPFNAKYWACSVSTCNRPRTGYVFCTVSCWDSHIAEARHRDAWADEKRAPSKEAWDKELAANPEAAPPPAAPKPVAQQGSAPVRRVVGDASPSTAAAVEGNIQLADAEREILIVVSKMKKYIKDRSGFNCSDAVAEVLSEHVRAICDESIRAAARDERKTVLDRDVPKPRR